MKKVDTKPIKRTQKDYNLGFKLAVVEQVEKGELTYKQAQQLYGIQGRSTVLVWLRKHGKLAWTNPYEKTMSKASETPAQKLKRLERELEDMEIRNKVLNRMVDICDKEYGMGLRKKYYAEVSKDSSKKGK